MNNEEERILKLYYPFYEKENELKTRSDELLLLSFFVTIFKLFFQFIIGTILNIDKIIISEINTLLTLIAFFFILGSIILKLLSEKFEENGYTGRKMLYYNELIKNSYINEQITKIEDQKQSLRPSIKNSRTNFKNYFKNDSDNPLIDQILHLHESVYNQYFKMRTYKKKYTFVIFTIWGTFFVSLFLGLLISNYYIENFFFNLAILLFASPLLMNLKIAVFDWEKLTQKTWYILNELEKIKTKEEYFYLFHEYTDVTNTTPNIPSKIFYNIKATIEDSYDKNYPQIKQKIENNVLHE